MKSNVVADLEKLAEELSANHRRFMRTLVEARERVELTQEEVARRMGVSQAAVSQFERYDSNPTLSTIRRYALAVGVGLRDDIIYSLHPAGYRELAQMRSVEIEPMPEPDPIRSDWISATSLG